MARSAPPIALATLDPDKIGFDPATYQFRSGGDANGITKTYKITEENWDPGRHANPILVHERNDGSLFVADGHHRLDLIKRLRTKGKGPANVQALVLREADGYTPEDVRVIAAYVNMDKGHATAVESARVFKEAHSGRVHEEWLPQLQLDKSNLHIAYTMSGLSDAALDTVEKRNVPDIIAAQVAQKFQPAQQEAILRFLADSTQNAYALKNEPAYDVHVQQPPVIEAGHAARILQQRAQSANRTR